jgi:hypothetical protein
MCTFGTIVPVHPPTIIPMGVQLMGNVVVELHNGMVDGIVQWNLRDRDTS